MERIVFYILALAIVLFSVLTVTSRNILRAAIYLLFVLMATAGLYFLLNYNFLAAVQLTVYSGGVVVLIVFAVLLTVKIDHKLPPVGNLKAIVSMVLVAMGVGTVVWAVAGFNFTPTAQPATGYDVKAIGTSLLSYGNYGYVLPFEVISVLLLAAMVGAIMIAKRYKND